MIPLLSILRAAFDVSGVQSGSLDQLDQISDALFRPLETGADGNPAVVLDGAAAPPIAQVRAAVQAWLDAQAATQYQRDRAEAYALSGVTHPEMIVALWERIVEGRPEYADALQAKRAAIKTACPKPGV